MASPGMSWPTFLNAAGFVFDIFGVYCLLVGGAVWRETFERPRSPGRSGIKVAGRPVGSVERLSIWGVTLVMMGLLLHAVSSFS
jgi:hypothetical protein